MRRSLTLVFAVVAVSFVLAVGVAGTANPGKAVQGRGMATDTGLLAVASHAVTPSRVIAVVPSVAGARLRPLDARTLAPLRPGWSRAVGWSKEPGLQPAVLSPSGSRIAVVVGPSGSESVVVLDTATGRVVKRYVHPGDTSSGVYWLGGDGTAGSKAALLVAVGGTWRGTEFTVVGSENADDYEVGDPAGSLREGLVLVWSPTTLGVWGDGLGGSYGNLIDFDLPRMPLSAPFHVVTDIAHDRLFAISSAGLVARIDHLFGTPEPDFGGRKPAVSYHRVALNGRPFEAAWAGSGKIALWGQDGLGTIDIRTWRTRAVAPGVTGVVATPFGLAAWTHDPAEGLSVYRPDGSRRLRVLAGKRIQAARAVGSYLYADTDTNTRYSVNLRTGKVTGPLPNNAEIIAPTLVPIP